MLKEIELPCSKDIHSEFSFIEGGIVNYEMTYKSNPRVSSKTVFHPTYRVSLLEVGVESGSLCLKVLARGVDASG